MALDIVDVRNKVINLLDKNNTTTSGYDISTGLAVRVGSVTAGNPDVGHINTQYPVVFVDIYEHREELELLGLGSHQKTNFNVEIVPVIQYGAGIGQSAVEDEMLRLTENINNLIRAKPGLSVTGISTNTLSVDFTNPGESTYVKQSKIVVDSMKYVKSLLQVPIAPSNLTATAASDVQIDLGWTNNATDETGFEIQRKTTGDYATLTTVAADTTSMSDTGLVASTQYTYKIRAYNALGYSDFSNEADATTNASSSFSYTNSDGNVTDWVEVYDSNNNHALTDAGNNQRITTSSSTNGYARYQYSDLALGDFYMQVKYVGQYFLGGTNYIQVGVRTNGTETTAQKGYWFQHAIGSGTWTVAGGGTTITWGSTDLNTSCTIAAGSVIKITVTGTGASTSVSIAVDGTTYYTVSNPGTVYNTGSFGIGTNTNYSAAYSDWDDYLVESI